MVSLGRLVGKTPTAGAAGMRVTDDPLGNSIVIINSTAVLEEGTTFIFGSWVCIANVNGGFNSHLTKPRGP